MRFEAFEKRAGEEWERIPEAYREGVDGLVVERGARPHDSLVDVYTLGECITESYPSDWGGPDTIRSFVVLYYGSFQRLSKLDAEFDWETELWETLTHELQHHLESLADDEGLVDMDFAVDEGFKRREGEPFDPSFYRAGKALGDGWFRVDEELFVEVRVESDADAAAFTLDGVEWRVSLPQDRGDVAFVEVETGLPADAPPITVVCVRRRGMVERLRGALRGESRRIVESRSPARRA